MSRKSPAFEPRTCSVCGETYQPTGSIQKMCPRCKKEHISRYKRQWWLNKHPDSRPKEKSGLVCCICGRPFRCSFQGLPYCNKHYLRMKTNGTAELTGRRITNTIQKTERGVVQILTANKVPILIDESDLEKALLHSWCISKTKYAVASINGKTVKMHRYLLGILDDHSVVVDHINGNTLDNRRANLRICTTHENSFNLKKKVTNTSGYTGIRKLETGKYNVRINLNRKGIHIGNFDTLEQAIEAREAAEKRYHGQYAGSLRNKTNQEG